jgi:hypothetical protein
MMCVWGSGDLLRFICDLEEVLMPDIMVVLSFEGPKAYMRMCLKKC